MKQKATKPIIFPNCRRHRRNGGEAWIERTNPLTRLSLRVAQNIYDSARTGAFTRLQYIYSEVERTDPILLLCVERRLSALSSLGWLISLNDDSAEANRQKEVLENLLNTADNLSDAIEHLGLAFFRGFSFAAPFMKDGRLSFALPPTWEFNRSLDGTWWHNPLAIEGGPGGEGQNPFDPCNVLFIERKRPVDYPALALFIRRDVAEDQWGRFIDRYGIPPVILEMPPVTNELDADKFAEAARSIYEALCGSVPNGTKVNTLAEARGTDPFSAFVEHQEKTIVRLATGGTLGSIAEAGSGTLAGNAQADVWRDIVSRDAVKIGEEFTRWFGRFLFPEGMLVKFELGLEKRNTPGEVFDMAAKAKTAGYIFTKEYLESETGAELEKDVQNTPQDPLFNPETPRPPLRNAATAFKTPKSAFKTARKDLDAQGAVSAENGSEGVLEAFCKDGSKAAQEVLKLLEDPTAEKAAELIEKLPSLLPEDPALAAVIAEAMAEEFRVPSDGVEELKVNNVISHPCPKCKRQLRRDGGCTYCERQTLLAGKLRRISPNEAKSLLSEPVSVKNPTGFEVKFTGEKLLADDAHLKAHHNNADYERRARVMLYAVDAAKTSRDVRTSRATKPNKDGVYAQRKEIRKQYTDPKSGRKFEVVVLADNNGDVYEVFDVYPR